MEISQLNYFKVAAQYESFTLAAEQLHMTQSALSRSIAALEEDIGFRLFERVGNRIHLNSNGQYFLIQVKAVLNTLEHTVEETKAMCGLDCGVVRIAVSETVFIKHIIRSFLQDQPNVRIQSQVLSNEQIRTCLEEGTINFAVTREHIMGSDLTWDQIFTDRMLVMLPKGHPLEGRASLHLRELAEDHFIISNIGYQMHSDVIGMCQLAGFEPYIIYEGHGEDLAGILVGDGLGVMLAPYTISKGVAELRLEQQDEDVHGIPVADDFASLPIGICERRGAFQSEAARELRRRICQYYAGLEPCQIQ